MKEAPNSKEKNNIIHGSSSGCFGFERRSLNPKP